MTNTTPANRVLVTGAAGHIGTAFREHAGKRYNLRLADLPGKPISDPAGHEVVALDITSLDSCREACAGMDMVVHLAADPSAEADFYGSLLDANVKGTYNVFRAAADQGCRRVVFASSIHAVLGYPPDVRARPDSPVRPTNMYGVSKCFGEAVAHYFAATEGLSCIAIRIGAFEGEWMHDWFSDELRSAFISRRDMSHLLERCIETPGIDFAIVHGISNNRVQRLDLTATRELLDYTPQDDGFEILPAQPPE